MFGGDALIDLCTPVGGRRLGTSPPLGAFSRKAIDSLPQVKFWIRNVARHPQAFWPPTASDKFYPDFAAQLTDGRMLVIEYEGALLAGAGIDDTNEKRAIGRLWEQRSAGKGLFVVVEKVIDGKDMRAQLIEKVRA